MRQRLYFTLLGLLLGLTLAGCSKQTLEAFSGPTMGSTYSIKYVSAPGVPPKAQLQAETEAILADLDRQLSTWRSDSDVQRFNELPAGGCQRMPADLLELVAAGARLSVETEGALDLSLQPLLELWGFGAHSRGEQVPSAEQIEAARALTGLHQLRTRDGQLCKEVALQLDFNSIAAGYAVDLVAERLQQLGVTSYLVEITGELRAQGRKPDQQPWLIAIEAPLEGERTAQRVLELDGLAVSTSGDYRNYFERAGRRYSHILDPRSGLPIGHNLAAVTVVDPSALRADGLSTALMVLGPQAGFEFAQQHGIAALFVVREGVGFSSRSSAAFSARFDKGEAQ